MVHRVLFWVGWEAGGCGRIFSGAARGSGRWCECARGKLAEPGLVFVVLAVRVVGPMCACVRAASWQSLAHGLRNQIIE